MKVSNPRLLLLAVAGPALAWVIGATLWLAAAAAGVPRAFDGRTMTLTEATAVASHADVARLLQDGADPNAPSRLRAGIVRNRESVMTPLEAATAAIRTGPVQMLIDHGATIDQDNVAVLWCAAVARRNGDMQTFLRQQSPRVNVPADCAGVRTLW